MLRVPWLDPRLASVKGKFCPGPALRAVEITAEGQPLAPLWSSAWPLQEKRVFSARSELAEKSIEIFSWCRCGGN